MNRQAFDKAAEILKTRPNHFYSLSAIERLVYTLPPPPKPADLDTAERVSKYLLDNLDAVFAPSNKPMDVKDADWATYKPAMKNAAQATLAWVYVQRKDHPKAETELTKYLHLDPTQARTSLSLGGELLAQNQDHPEKLPLGLYQFAHAASYDGPEQPAGRGAQAGSRLPDQDLHDVSRLQRRGWTSCWPWPRTVRSRRRGSAIESAQQIAAKKAAEEEDFVKAHPDLGLWQTAIKEPLTQGRRRGLFRDEREGRALAGRSERRAEVQGQDRLDDA